MIEDDRNLCGRVLLLEWISLIHFNNWSDKHHMTKSTSSFNFLLNLLVRVHLFSHPLFLFFFLPSLNMQYAKRKTFVINGTSIRIFHVSFAIFHVTVFPPWWCMHQKERAQNKFVTACYSLTILIQNMMLKYRVRVISWSLYKFNLFW